MDHRTRGLCQVIKVNERIKFFRHELFLIDESLVNPMLKIAEMKEGLSDFISAIMPNQEISEQLWNAYNQISLAFLRRKPFSFIVEDFKDAIYEIIHKALPHFKEVLDRQPGHVIEFYMQSQLNELETLAIMKPAFGQGFMEYLTELKTLVKLELKKRSGQQYSHLAHIGLLDFRQDKKEGKPDNNKTLAFNLIKTNDERILAVMNYLIFIKAIPGDTTFAQFKSKFDNKNGTDPIEWLASQGDLATFIKELVRIAGPEFAPYNQHLNIAVICFVQKGGIPFDPQKLRNSKPTIKGNKFIKAARKF
jgi:hypothetical protein